MWRRFIQCDVFSDQPLKGNGLAVVLDGAGLTDAQMLAFAQWTQQAETTFLFPPSVPQADYKVRIFSATREMPFAGHPTLGSAAAWVHVGGMPHKVGKIVQECAIGLVEIDISGPAPAFVAPPTTCGPMQSEERARICAALKIAQDEVLSSVTLDNGVQRQVLELRDAARVLSLDANAVGLPGFPGVSIVGAYPEGSEVDYEVRNLSPASMMPEDAVTGSLIAAIAVWLRDAGRMPQDIVIGQGTAIGRAGRAFLSQRGPNVMIGGQSSIVIEGMVEL